MSINTSSDKETLVKPATRAEEIILARLVDTQYVYGYLTLKELREKCDATTSTKKDPRNNSTAEAEKPQKQT